MVVTETNNHGYKKQDKGDEDWHTPLNNTLDLLDVDVLLKDTLSNRPSAGTEERAFLSTDTKELYYDNGTQWQKMLSLDHGDLLNVGSSDHHTRPSAGTAIADNSNTFDFNQTLSEAGTSVTTGPTDVNFTGTNDANVTVSDDGDGTATVDVDVTGGSSISDSGTQVLASPTDVNYGNQLGVTDDGDGTATVDVQDFTTTTDNIDIGSPTYNVSGSILQNAIIGKSNTINSFGDASSNVIVGYSNTIDGSDGNEQNVVIGQNNSVQANQYTMNNNTVIGVGNDITSNDILNNNIILSNGLGMGTSSNRVQDNIIIDTSPAVTTAWASPLEMEDNVILGRNVLPDPSSGDSLSGFIGLGYRASPQANNSIAIGTDAEADGISIGRLASSSSGEAVIGNGNNGSDMYAYDDTGTKIQYWDRDLGATTGDLENVGILGFKANDSFVDEATPSNRLNLKNGEVISNSEFATNAISGNDLFTDPAGKRVYLIESGDIHQYTLGTANDPYSAPSSPTTSVALSDTGLSCFIGKDGEKLFILYSASPNFIEEYDLSTPYDLSTKSAMVNSLSLTHAAEALYFKPDGSQIYLFGDNEVTVYDLSTDWDLSTATQSNNFGDGFIGGINSVEISKSGYKLIGTDTSDTTRTFELMEPYNPASYDNYTTSTNFTDFNYGVASIKRGSQVLLYDRGAGQIIAYKTGLDLEKGYLNDVSAISNDGTKILEISGNDIYLEDALFFNETLMLRSAGNNSIQIFGLADDASQQISIGDGADSRTTARTMAIGANTDARDFDDSIAFGYNAKTQNANELAIGNQNSGLDIRVADSGGVYRHIFDRSAGKLTGDSRRIINVADPSNAQDAATKNYVDNTTTTTNTDQTTNGEDYISINTSSNAVTLTLSTADSEDGNKISVRREGANNVTIDTEGTQTINNSSNIDLTTDGETITLVYFSTDTDWKQF